MGHWLAGLILMVASLQAVWAHEVRPGYLQIREIGPRTYDLLWKTPARDGMRLALQVMLPEHCERTGDVQGVLLHDAVLERWQLRCPEGLEGKPLSVSRLGATLTDVIVRFEPLGRAPVTLRLTGDSPQAALPQAQTRWQVGLQYLGLGVAHILTGWDHLAFVLLIVWLTAGWRRLLVCVSLFTLAHSLSLVGTALGWIRLPVAPVEALIALSILLVALQVARAGGDSTVRSDRHPGLMIFAFGLLHGFGFAGALHETGLPADAIAEALLGFNLGVEIGQLLFIAAVLCVVWIARRVGSPMPEWARTAPLYAIGGLSAFWFLSRTAQVLIG